MATQLSPTRSDWLAAHPPAAERLSQTLAARRGASEEARTSAMPRASSSTSSRCAATIARGPRRSPSGPTPTGDRRHDAYLGALAEHLAAVHGLSRPAWSVEPGRFLDRFWFVSDVPGFRAIAIAQAPAAFRRRGVFVPERSLHRV